MRWRVRLLVIVAIVAAIGIGYARVVRWRPESLGPVRAERAATLLASDELDVLTINAWLLSQPHRVPALLDAIDGEGAALAGGRPALVAVQELRSRAAIRALARDTSDEGFFGACECSVRSDGSLRSAVAAIVRRPWRVREHACVPLARIPPDERRCALVTQVEDAEARRFSFVVTHLAWHPASRSMAARLREELAARGALGATSIVAGDFNAWPGTDAYAVLTRPPLRDARPDAPPTHYLGRTMDHVLIGDAFEVVRGLDRRASFARIRPGAGVWVPAACELEGPPACPVSDHLPEGVVLRWRARSARSGR